MSTDKHKEKSPARKRVSMMLAEFDKTSTVLHAAEKVRDAGYKKWDTHTPFPIHGMDKAMGLPDSRLGWIVLVMGITGLASAIAMIAWMNGIDYPLIIGGKPPISIPSFVPVCFELTVLFSAFGAVFGMLGLNRLPQHNHPIFASDRFRSASDDKFYLSIEALDPKFDAEKTRALLEGANATFIELVEEEEES